jgi:hypothetical protein
MLVALVLMHGITLPTVNPYQKLEKQVRCGARVRFTGELDL